MFKYNYIYIVTDNLNNKKYIGKHSTNNLEDEYMGSGVEIKKIIKEGNKKYLSKEIIEWCSSEEEAYEREKYWINYYNAVEDDNFYNIKNGGEGFPPSQKDIIREKIRQKALERGAWQGNSNPGHINAEKLKGEGNPFYGKHHTEETKQKLRELRLGTHLSEETKQKIRENSPNKIKVKCIETGIIYDSLKEAGQAVGLKDGCGISRYLQGRNNYAGKDNNGQPLHWEKIIDE